VERTLRSGLATEHSYRPALKGLIEALGPGTTATNDPKRVACGAPDYVVSRDTGHGPLTVGYVETKDVGVSLEETERGEQLGRYLPSLDNLLLTDYLEFRWYVGGKRRLMARLGSWDRTRGGRLVPDRDGVTAVDGLLDAFLARQPEPIRTPRELAQRMARLTHLFVTSSCKDSPPVPSQTNSRTYERRLPRYSSRTYPYRNLQTCSRRR